MSSTIEYSCLRGQLCGICSLREGTTSALQTDSIPRRSFPKRRRKETSSNTSGVYPKYNFSYIEWTQWRMDGTLLLAHKYKPAIAVAPTNPDAVGFPRWAITEENSSRVSPIPACCHLGSRRKLSMVPCCCAMIGDWLIRIERQTRTKELREDQTFIYCINNEAKSHANPVTHIPYNSI